MKPLCNFLGLHWRRECPPPVPTVNTEAASPAKSVSTYLLRPASLPVSATHLSGSPLKLTHRTGWPDRINRQRDRGREARERPWKKGSVVCGKRTADTAFLPYMNKQVYMAQHDMSFLLSCTPTAKPKGEARGLTPISPPRTTAFRDILEWILQDTCSATWSGVPHDSFSLAPFCCCLKHHRTLATDGDFGASEPLLGAPRQSRLVS